jgi:hypothetical protein
MTVHIAMSVIGAFCKINNLLILYDFKKKIGGIYLGCFLESSSILLYFLLRNDHSYGEMGRENKRV